MPSPSEILSAVAPKFDSVDGARLSTVLGLATSQVGSVFGTQRNTAIAYLAAHMLEIGNAASGSGGIITEETEGGLSRSYSGNANTKPTAYDRTVYGQEFVRIRKQCVMGARTRVSNTAIPPGEV